MGAAVWQALGWAGDSRTRREACGEGSVIPNMCCVRGNLGCRGGLE